MPEEKWRRKREVFRWRWGWQGGRRERRSEEGEKRARSRQAAARGGQGRPLQGLGPCLPHRRPTPKLRLPTPARSRVSEVRGPSGRPPPSASASPGPGAPWLVCLRVASAFTKHRGAEKQDRPTRWCITYRKLGRWEYSGAYLSLFFPELCKIREEGGGECQGAVS